MNEFSGLQNEYLRLTGDVTKTQGLMFAKQQIDFAIKNKAIITARTVVARVESIPLSPSLAKIATSEAKKAERSA